MSGIISAWVEAWAGFQMVVSRVPAIRQISAIVKASSLLLLAL